MPLESAVAWVLLRLDRTIDRRLSRDERLNARLGAALCASIAALLTLFAPAFALFAGLVDIAALCVVFAVAFGALALAYGRLRPGLALSALIALCYALETIAVVRNGGPESPLLAYVVFPTLYAALLGGAGAGAAATVGAVVYVAVLNGLGAVITFGAVPDARSFWLVSVPPMSIVGFAVVAVASALRDAARREVDDARASAEIASRVKEDFLAVTSHEMRSPLSGILGAAELIASNPADAEAVARWSQVILRSADRLHALVDDLLDFKLIERGDVALEDVRFDPRHVLGDVVLLAARDAAGTRIDVDVGADLAPSLRGDPHRVAQIVTNLVDNAVHAAKGGRVEVRASGALRVEVIDDGPGVPESARETVFEPFVQAEPGAQRSKPGAGLGLAVSRRLAELMGGTLELLPSEEGARFVLDVTLPRADGVDEEHPAARAEGRALDVLVVDDGEAPRAVLGGLLRLMGHRVRELSSGPEAVEACARRRPDLVLVDLHMPGMDGFETAHRLRQTAPGIALLAHTASTSRRDMDRAAALGLDPVLCKPFTAAELAAAVRGAMDAARSRDGE